MQVNLIIISREVEQQEDQKTDGEPCTESSRCKIKNWTERSENRTDWDKSIKEAEEEEEEEEDAGQQDAINKLTGVIKKGYVHSLRPFFLVVSL
jgi:ribosomal protein S20